MVPAFPNEGMLPLSCARSAGEIHGQWRLTADLEGFVGREDIKIVLSLTERTLGGEAGWREARVNWTKNERSIALVVVARQDLTRDARAHTSNESNDVVFSQRRVFGTEWAVLVRCAITASLLTAVRAPRAHYR